MITISKQPHNPADHYIHIGSAHNEKQTEQMQIVEVKDALKSLGYTEQEIRTIVPELQKAESENIDELIRLALSLMVKN